MCVQTAIQKNYTHYILDNIQCFPYFFWFSANHCYFDNSDDVYIFLLYGFVRISVRTIIILEQLYALSLPLLCQNYLLTIPILKTIQIKLTPHVPTRFTFFISFISYTRTIYSVTNPFRWYIISHVDSVKKANIKICSR